MPDLAWTESLEGPRSLATAVDVAIAAIEDPGVVEVRAGREDAAAREAIAAALDGELPTTPWATSALGPGVRAVWCGPDRWRMVMARENVPTVLVRLAEARGAPIHVSDLTGGFAIFRIVGDAGPEVLGKACPLNLSQVMPGEARASTIGSVATLLIREEEAIPSWLALAPRSFADHVARTLVEAARSPDRINLFAPAPPPPV